MDHMPTLHFKSLRTPPYWGGEKKIICEIISLQHKLILKCSPGYVLYHEN